MYADKIIFASTTFAISVAVLQQNKLKYWVSFDTVGNEQWASINDGIVIMLIRAPVGALF